jgi:hypothetical protein
VPAPDAAAVSALEPFVPVAVGALDFSGVALRAINVAAAFAPLAFDRGVVAALLAFELADGAAGLAEIDPALVDETAATEVKELVTERSERVGRHEAADPGADSRAMPVMGRVVVAGEDQGRAVLAHDVEELRRVLERPPEPDQLPHALNPPRGGKRDDVVVEREDHPGVAAPDLSECPPKRIEHCGTEFAHGMMHPEAQAAVGEGAIEPDEAQGAAIEPSKHLYIGTEAGTKCATPVVVMVPGSTVERAGPNPYSRRFSSKTANAAVSPPLDRSPVTSRWSTSYSRRDVNRPSRRSSSSSLPVR